MVEIGTVKEEEIKITTDDQKLIDDLLEGTNGIILYNDDVNTFDHVINCLVKYCGHAGIQAEQCALIVHTKGRCRVKEGTFKKLLPINEALQESGLSSVIE